MIRLTNAKITLQQNQACQKIICEISLISSNWLYKWEQTQKFSQLADIKHSDTLKMSYDTKNFYQSNHPKLGVAIIFNHNTFQDGNEERHGSIKDTNDLSEVLTEWGFDVRLFKDQTVENVKKELLNGMFG